MNGLSVHMGHRHRKLSNCDDLESIQIDQIDGNTEVEEEESSKISKFRKMSYTISCNEPKIEHDVDKDLTKVMIFIHISGWDTDKYKENYSVKVLAEHLLEDFPITSAIKLQLLNHMLKTLPWPKG